MASYTIAEAYNEGYYVCGLDASKVLYAGTLKGALIFVESKLATNSLIDQGFAGVSSTGMARKAAASIVNVAPGCGGSTSVKREY